MRTLALLLLTCLALQGQSYDRLTLRPRSQGGSWDPGAVRFYDAQWPVAFSEIQYVGLQAREHQGLERYTLTWPAAGPTEDSCFLVEPDGTMSYVALDAEGSCKRGRLRVPGRYVGLASQSTGNPSFEYNRKRASLTGIDAMWVESWAAAESDPLGTWMFAVPGGLSDPPVFFAYVYSSSAIGDNPLYLYVGCVTPAGLLDDSEQVTPFSLVDFDDPVPYVFDPTGEEHLHRIEVPLVNTEWQVGDLCLVGVKNQTAVGAFNLTYFLEVGLE